MRRITAKSSNVDAAEQCAVTAHTRKTQRMSHESHEIRRQSRRFCWRGFVATGKGVNLPNGPTLNSAYITTMDEAAFHASVLAACGAKHVAVERYG